MSKPTLFRQGSLVAKNDQQQAEFDKWRPIDYIMQWIKDRQSKAGMKNRVCVLKSETASGKSTAMPGELYLQITRGTRDNIIITQPRVLTAVRNVLEMLGVEQYRNAFRLGENIGWSTGFNKLKPRSYGLTSATIGTLYMQLCTWTDEDILRKYRYILIDETHERNMQIDMTLYMLKNFLIRNEKKPECPFLFLMSATFNPESFLKYYDLPPENFIWCRGASQGHEDMWNWNGDRVVNSYPQAAANVIDRIVRNAPDETICDVIVFLPGKGEFRETDKYLQAINKSLVKDGIKPVSILQVDSNSERQNTRDYQLVDIPVAKHRVTIDKKQYTPGRRVILSTNVAETGLTLPEIKYVVDAGYNKQVEFNPNYGIRGLLTKPASRSNITQRRGRAGRKFKGVFYPLYPKYIYDSLAEIQLPQILYEDLSTIILDIFAEQERSGGKPSTSMDMIDCPPFDSVWRAIELTTSLGFTTTSCQFTDMGRIALTMLGLPLEIRRMILSGWTWRVSIIDLITIAAGLLVDAKSLTIKGEQINWLNVYQAGAPSFMKGDKMTLKMRLLLADDFVDMLFLMNAVKSTQSGLFSQNVATLREFCAASKLQYDGIIEFIKKRDDLIEQLLGAEFDLFCNEEHSLHNTPNEQFTDYITRVKYCIYDGFRLNMLTMVDDKYYSGNLEVMPPAVLADVGKTRDDMKKWGIERIMPKKLLFYELSLKHNRKNNIYSVKAERVSAVDGWIYPDDYYTY